MTSSKEVYDKIDEVYEEFKSNVNGRTKKAFKSARSNATALKKLLTQYKKLNLEEEKQSKVK